MSIKEEKKVIAVERKDSKRLIDEWIKKNCQGCRVTEGEK